MPALNPRYIEINFNSINEEFRKALEIAKSEINNKDDVLAMLGKSEENIEAAFGMAGMDESLREFLQLELELLRDYFGGEYNDISTEGVISLLAGFLYLNKENDVIPDDTPLYGFVDDEFVLKTVYLHATGDIEKYKVWKS